MVKSDEWRERVEAWRASGKSAAEFCSDQDYSPKSLQWWAWHFGGQKRKRSSRATKPQFARVIAKRDTAKHTSDAPVVVHLAGARIEIGTGADRTVVSMILESLRAPSAGGRA